MDGIDRTEYRSAFNRTMNRYKLRTPPRWDLYRFCTAIKRAIKSYKDENRKVDFNHLVTEEQKAFKLSPDDARLYRTMADNLHKLEEARLTQTSSTDTAQSLWETYWSSEDVQEKIEEREDKLDD